MKSLLSTTIKRAAVFVALMAMLAAATLLANAATIDTAPATDSVGTFGFPATKLFGVDFTAPSGVTQLDDATVWVQGALTLGYTLNVCAFNGSACSAAPLWTSGSLAGTGSGNLDPMFQTIDISVVSGQDYLLYLAATGGTGTGKLGLSATTGANEENFWFQNGATPNPLSGWSNLVNNQVAVVLDFSGGTVGDGGSTVPEPATAPLIIAAAGVVTLALRRKKIKN